MLALLTDHPDPMAVLCARGIDARLDVSPSRPLDEETVPSERNEWTFSTEELTVFCAFDCESDPW
jgi:hypothetical protein